MAECFFIYIEDTNSCGEAPNEALMKILKGDTGNGIASITQTSISENELEKTYTITYTDGNEFEYIVKDGNSILSIEYIGISEDGLQETYQVNYKDGTTFQYVVNQGVGIKTITKTSTTLLTDTYTITFADNSITTFDVKNGNGIESIAKTNTNVLVDTYTITFTDTTTTTFDVTNAKSITNIEFVSSDLLTDTYKINFNDNTNITFDVANGRGINDVSYISTNGLVDTYRITYNDNTTSDFIVTNGAKGDNSFSPYIDETTKTWWEYNDTTKEYEDTGIAAKSVDIYNITNEIPLGAGLFYTLTTAITATPIANRKKGLLLMFESSAGVWETYQFKGVIANWSVLGSWSNDLSLKIDKTAISLYNITNEIPLPAGSYYTLATAIAAIPTNIRKLGLKITFQVSATNTETWEFFNGTIGNITNVAYWRKTANSTDLAQLAGDVKRKVDFIIPKNNLLNRALELPNKYVNQTSGNIEYNASYSASDWIAVKSSTNYYGNTINRLAWYDENRVYISGLFNPTMPITSPSTAKYIRVSYTPGNVYIVEGSVAVTYEAFKFLFSLLEVNTSQLSGDLQPAQIANFRLKSDLIEKSDTNFFEKSKNLFNKETYIPNTYVNQNTGVIYTSSSHWASDYIKIQGGLPYYAIGINSIAWYDANKVFISGAYNPTVPLTAPANAEYIRLSCYNVTSIQNFQFDQNTEATSYEPFYEIITRDSIAPWIDVYRELNDKIEANDLDILERNKNLFIQETYIPNVFINQTSGAIVSSSTNWASDYIKVQGGLPYYAIGFNRMAWYDANKVFISGAYNPTVPLTAPANAEYIRLSCENGGVSPQNFQFEQNTEATSYVKGGYVHKSYIIPEASPVSLPVTEIVMPPKYVAVVGSPIQIFYHGLIKAINPYKYNLRVNCARGKDFRRYWEFTPELSDIGTYTLTLYLYDDANNPISSASTQIEVVEFVQSPTVKKNILTIGDSLNNGAGDWGDSFAKQVVDGTDILTGLTAITNIDFVGELGVAPKQYTGWGGWSWESYNIEPDPSTADIWIYAAHDKDASDQESLWTDANSNIWQLETIESTRLKFKRYGGHTAAMPASPNALTHNMNAVHTATINYTSIQVAEQNPFWNAGTSEVDFVNWFSSKYPTKHSVGEGIDACFVLLGWNGRMYGKLTPADWDDYVLTAKTFIDNLHADYPSCKVYVMGLQYPSLNGGLGNNYGAGANSYAELWSVMQSVQSLNKAYEALCDDAIYSSFCKFINISGQFDSEFNMPYSTTPVNLRSSITERLGNNGVHPSVEGYMQISDAAIRMLIKEFCQ